MALPFPAGQLAYLCENARNLVTCAAHHKNDLDALAAAADADVRRAETALTHALDGRHVSSEGQRALLSSQLQRSLHGAEAARQLLVGAGEQYTAASRLLTLLEADRSARPRIGQPPSVLVVDDYRDIRELVAWVLQDAGFTVRMAANGLEALLAAYEMRPAVIVMDVTMPVLDGIEATRLIKATDATRNARVIAYTGDAGFDETSVRTLFAAVLPKTAPPTVVLSTVQRIASL
jgi:two-component system, cell cycle response regulator DivK